MFPLDSTLAGHISPTGLPHAHDWDAVGPVPAKPAHWEYGYVIKGQTYNSTREALPKVFAERGAQIEFVWTPETPEPVFPERIPFLIETFRRNQVSGARAAIWLGAAMVALGLLVTVLFKYPPKYFRLMIEGIVLIGALGLFGFAFIDNAAHLGGLVGGVALGWFFAKRSKPKVESRTSLLKFGGVVALGVLAVVTATVIYKLIG